MKVLGFHALLDVSEEFRSQIDWRESTTVENMLSGSAEVTLDSGQVVAAVQNEMVVRILSEEDLMACIHIDGGREFVASTPERNGHRLS
ncbi:MAG TPA: hypothetical protein PLA50_01215, partial [Bacteroidia bacterium]|nr:hypothetical protein [Bacteroidia bacterium]